jgi:hypothetical protein
VNDSLRLDVILLARDLEVVRDRYGSIGLKVVREGDGFVTFDRGDESRLTVTRSTTAGDGIADLGTAVAVWLRDPDRNPIGLLQLERVA